MKLENRQIRWLKGKAHSLKPVVTIGGKGLTPEIMAETIAALAHHELIKIKLPAVPKPDRAALVTELSKGTGAYSVAQTGRIAILFLGNPKRKNGIGSQLTALVSKQ